MVLASMIHYTRRRALEAVVHNLSYLLHRTGDPRVIATHLRWHYSKGTIQSREELNWVRAQISTRVADDRAYYYSL